MGLVGVGRHGQRYARHLTTDVRGLRLASIARRDEVQGRLQAAELGCTYHAGWRELIADPKVEAVCLTLPPGLHREVALAVARAGKPLLVEKPLATTARDARAICRAFERSGSPLMVAHTLRYHPALRCLKERLRAIGPVRAIHGAMRQEPLPHAWKRDPRLSGGGCVMQIGVHLFDTIRYLTGEEPSRLWCETRRVLNPAVEDVASCVFTLRGSGALCTVEVSKVSGGRTGLLTVVGERGQLIADFINGTLTKVVGRKMQALSVRGQPHAIKAVLEDFRRSVARGTPPPVTGQDGLQAVRVAEACYRSAAEGRPVTLR